MAGQRGCQAVEHTDTVEEGADKSGILLQLVRAVELHADVAPIRPQSFADRSQQPPWVDRIMHDIEGGDHIVLLGQPLRYVSVFEANAIGYTCRLSIGCGSRTGWSERVVSYIA